MKLDGDEWILMEMNIYRDEWMEGGRDGWMNMNGGECIEIHGWMEVDDRCMDDVQMDGWKWMHG